MPSAHTPHSEALAALEVPAEQGLQTDADGAENEPAEHVVWAPATQNEPAAHGPHSVAPACEYEPSAHVAHSVACSAAVNVPGRHDVHCSAPCPYSMLGSIPRIQLGYSSATAALQTSPENEPGEQGRESSLSAPVEP